MVAILSAVIALLIGIVFYLNVAFYNEKRRFRARIEAMHAVIADITRKQSGQSGKIQLSDELNETLRARQQTLSESIFRLNYALFDLVAKNNSGKP